MPTLGQRSGPTPGSKRVLAAIPDLFFGSKVSGAASRLGVEVRFAASRQAVLKEVDLGADLLLIDLDAGALDPVGLIVELRALPAASRLRLVAFASHVHPALLEEAKAAGCDDVLTRGALAANLPRLLAQA